MENFLKTLRKDDESFAEDVQSAVGARTIGTHYARTINTYYHEQRLQFVNACEEAGYGATQGGYPGKTFAVKPLDVLSLATKIASDGKHESIAMLDNAEDKDRAVWYKYNIGAAANGPKKMPHALARARERHKMHLQHGGLRDMDSSESDTDSENGVDENGEKKEKLSREEREKLRLLGQEDPSRSQAKPKQPARRSGINTGRMAINLATGRVVCEQRGDQKTRGLCLPANYGNGKQNRSSMRLPSVVEGSHARGMIDRALSRKMTLGRQMSRSRNFSRTRSKVSMRVRKSPAPHSDTEALSPSPGPSPGPQQSELSTVSTSAGRDLSRTRTVNFSISRTELFAPPQDLSGSGLQASTGKQRPSRGQPSDEALKVVTEAPKGSPRLGKVGSVGTVLAEARVTYAQCMKPGKEAPAPQRGPSMRRQMTIRSLARQMSGAALGNSGATAAYTQLRKAMRKEAKRLARMEEEWKKVGPRPMEVPDWDKHFIHGPKRHTECAEDEQRFWGVTHVRRPLVPRQLVKVASNRGITDVIGQEPKYHEAQKAKRVNLPSIM